MELSTHARLRCTTVLTKQGRSWHSSATRHRDRQPKQRAELAGSCLPEGWMSEPHPNCKSAHTLCSRQRCSTGLVRTAVCHDWPLCSQSCLVLLWLEAQAQKMGTVVHLRRAWVESSTWNQASPGPLGTDRWLAFSRSSRFSVNHELWSQNLEVFFRFY